MKYLLFFCGLIISNLNYSQHDYMYTDFGYNTNPLKVLEYKFIMPDSNLYEIVEYNFDRKGKLILEINKSSFTFPDTMILESTYYYENQFLKKIIMQSKGFSKDSKMSINFQYNNNKLQKIDYPDGKKYECRLFTYDSLSLNSEMSYYIDTILCDKFFYSKSENGKMLKQKHNRFYSNYTTTVIDSFVYLSNKERLWFSSWEYNFDKGKQFTTEYYDDNNNYIYSMVENKYPTSKYEYKYDSNNNWIQRRKITKEGRLIELIIRNITY